MYTENANLLYNTYFIFYLEMIIYVFSFISAFSDELYFLNYHTECERENNSHMDH